MFQPEYRSKGGVIKVELQAGRTDPKSLVVLKDGDVHIGEMLSATGLVALKTVGDRASMAGGYRAL